MPYGLLADDVGATGEEVVPAMCYRKGTFLRSQIEAANGIAISPGDTLDAALADPRDLLGR